MNNPEAVRKIVDAFNSNEFHEIGDVLERYSEERLTDFKERLKQSIDSDITNREHFIKLIDNLKS